METFHFGVPPLNVERRRSTQGCQDQLIGLEFFHDFARRIPRDEVGEIVATVRGAVLQRYGSRVPRGGDVRSGGHGGSSRAGWFVENP